MFNFFNELLLDSGEDNLVNSFVIVNISNCILYIEGIISVIKISKQSIFVKVKNNIIEIYGEELVIKKITTNTILVKGINVGTRSI